MVVTIILLYILTFMDFIFSLYPFVEQTSHGQNVWTRYLSLTKGHNILMSVGSGIMSIICNILADFIMVCAQLNDDRNAGCSSLYLNFRFGVAGWSGNSTI